jgi:hypothetical protein
VFISPIFHEQLFSNESVFAAFVCLQLGFEIFWRKEIGKKAAHKILENLTTYLILNTVKT